MDTTSGVAISTAIEPNTSLVLCEARDSKVPDSSLDSEPSAPLPIESDWAPIMEFTAADIFQHSPFGDILKSLKLRSRGINFVACPSCSRQNFDVIGVMNELEARLEDVRTPLDVAVIGCVVNGPGEAREADIGVTGASPSNLIYSDGKPDHKVSKEDLVDEMETMIRQRVSQQDAAKAS